MVKKMLAAGLAAALFLTGCDNNTDPAKEAEVPAGPTFDIVDSKDARPLPAQYGQGMAISYSGYRTNQSPNSNPPVYPSEAEILEDLNRLTAMGFTLIRTYGSGEYERRVLTVIRDNDLAIKMQLGVWISGSIEKADAANKTQCDQAIEWANSADFKDIIVSVSVGNECMVDWNTFGWQTPPNDIAHYVSYVRGRIAQPVTVDDNWEAWSLENEKGLEFYKDVANVIKAVDFIAIHTYAIFDAQYDLWEYKQEEVAEELRAEAMMNEAVVYTLKNYKAAADAMEGLGVDKPIVIGETGWRSTGDAVGIAHPVNQKMFYDKLKKSVFTDKSGPGGVIFFEAFDEPWKGGDDGWGLFNVNREAKYVVYATAAWAGGDVWTADEDETDFTAADAVFYRPPLPPTKVVAADNGNTFLVFADDLSTGYNGQLWDEDRNGVPEAQNLKWESWENNSTGTAKLDDAAANAQDAETSGADTVALVTPKPMGWGWGMMALMEFHGYDLSEFANGHLRFRVKTEYEGKLEVGIQTGLSATNDSMDWLVRVDPASNTYGYAADGEWHEVSVPIADLDAAKLPSYNNAGGSGLEKVFVPFVIADRAVPTDTAIDSAEILVDHIRWTAD